MEIDKIISTENERRKFVARKMAEEKCGERERENREKEREGVCVYE